MWLNDGSEFNSWCNNGNFYFKCQYRDTSTLEKTSPLVEKRRRKCSNLWFLPQTVSRLLLLCLTICGFPRPKIFQQNGGVTGGHWKEQIGLPIILPRVFKTFCPFLKYQRHHQPKCNGSATVRRSLKNEFVDFPLVIRFPLNHFIQSKRWTSRICDNCLHSTIFWRETPSIGKVAIAQL